MYVAASKLNFNVLFVVVVLQISYIDQDMIEVDAETKEMLKMLVSTAVISTLTFTVLYVQVGASNVYSEGKRLLL